MRVTPSLTLRATSVSAIGRESLDSLNLGDDGNPDEESQPSRDWARQDVVQPSSGTPGGQALADIHLLCNGAAEIASASPSCSKSSATNEILTRETLDVDGVAVHRLWT
jgi:hypothetical protein